MKSLGLAAKRRAAEVLQVGRTAVRVVDDGSLNGFQLGAIEVTLPPKTPQILPHVHHRYTITFLVTRGTVEFKVENGVYRASSGDYVAIPVGVPYTFSNPFESGASFHCAFSPSTLIQYFRELSAVTKSATPPEMKEWVEVMARYDIEPVEFGGDEKERQKTMGLAVRAKPRTRSSLDGGEAATL